MYLAASLAPRMEQAASHIQDSRDLPFGLVFDFAISLNQYVVGPSEPRRKGKDSEEGWGWQGGVNDDRPAGIDIWTCQQNRD